MLSTTRVWMGNVACQAQEASKPLLLCYCLLRQLALFLEPKQYKFLKTRYNPKRYNLSVFPNKTTSQRYAKPKWFP